MIKYGISEISIVPVRAEPAETSEQRTQVLFGETFEILEENDKWSYIKLTFDQYEGWIDKKTITYLQKKAFDDINSSSTYITKPFSEIILDKQNNEQIILPAGCTLPNFNADTRKFSINHHAYEKINNIEQRSLNIVDLCKLFLNAPYQWGGKNPFGIDCSGLVQIIYKILGINLPRDANMQVTQGETINFIGEIAAGDLAFFDNEEGEIIHVGIILNKEEIIHASGKVRIDKFDHQGIFNRELKKYTYKLRIIKRIL